MKSKRTMRFMIVAAALNSLLFMVTASGARGQTQTAFEWRRFTISDEDFSVLLPVQPAMSTTSYYLSRTQSRRERVLGAYGSGVVYAIYTFEKKNLSLADLIGRYEKKQAEELTERVAADGITGRVSRFENEDRLGVTEFFETSTNLYVFKAVGSKLGDPAAAMQKFLSSIKFGKDHGGTKITDGPGDQPADEATANETFKTKEINTRAVVITKPEPRYTQAARMNQVTGTVVLRVVFSSSGALKNISVVKDLPSGLTEQAIEAARQIRFIPAIKDGRFVSMYMQLEYNFNLY